MECFRPSSYRTLNPPYLDHKQTGNMVARSCNHCSSRNVISITYSECVFVALGIQHAMRMHHSVNCGLSGSKIFMFALLSQRGTIFEEQLLSIKPMLLIYSTTFA